MLFRSLKKLCQLRVRFRIANSLAETVISAPAYSKELTHDRYGIPLLVSVYYHVFYLCPHFLSVNRRKSRSNSFSIFNRLISYACSATISTGSALFRGLPFGRSLSPAFIFRSFRRSRFNRSFTTFLSLNPQMLRYFLLASSS